jgi:hypothetical protein
MKVVVEKLSGTVPQANFCSSLRWNSGKLCVIQRSALFWFHRRLLLCERRTCWEAARRPASHLPQKEGAANDQASRNESSTHRLAERDTNILPFTRI